MQRGTRMEMISYCILLRKPMDLCSFSSALHCIRWGSVPLYAAIWALTVLKRRQDFGPTHVMCDNRQRDCEKLPEVKLLRFLLTFPDFEAYIFYPIWGQRWKTVYQKKSPSSSPPLSKTICDKISIWDTGASDFKQLGWTTLPSTSLPVPSFFSPSVTN